MTNGKDYNRGVRDGTTETTLDSLSRSLHELIAMLGGYATIIGMLIKLVAQTADK